jgi:hypothetical protein
MKGEKEKKPDKEDEKKPQDKRALAAESFFVVGR